MKSANYKILCIYFFSIACLIVLNSCSTTKLHIVTQGIEEFDSYSSEDTEPGIIVQTIGKVNWATEMGAKGKNWVSGKDIDVSEQLLLSMSLPHKLDAKIDYNAESNGNLVAESYRINQMADKDHKIDYSKGYIPIKHTSDYIVYPSGIMREPFYNEHQPGVRLKLDRDIPYTCSPNQEKNYGHFSVIAAKKFNVVSKDAEVLFKLLKYLRRNYEYQEYDKCEGILSSYLKLFSTSELANMSETNKKNYEGEWLNLANEFKALNEKVNVTYFAGIPQYKLNDDVHNKFMDYYLGIYQNYSNNMLIKKGVVDSIVFNRLDLNLLSKSIDSSSKILNVGYSNLSNFVNKKLQSYLQPQSKDKLSEIFGSVSEYSKNVLNVYNQINLIKELKKRVVDFNNRYGQFSIHYNPLIEKLNKIEEKIKSSSSIYSDNEKELEKSLTALNLYVNMKKQSIINRYNEKLKSLPSGSILNFTPNEIRCRDKRRDENVSFLYSVVGVKKIENVDQFTMLVKVVKMPNFDIPHGSSLEDLEFESQLHLGAEMVLPFAHFEGYPGKFSDNEFYQMIDYDRY